MQKAFYSCLLAGFTMAVVSVPVPAAGLGGEAADLENARANARAGGPVSERDAELLRKYGCLSGTDNDFCRKLEHRPQETPRRRSRRPEQ